MSNIITYTYQLKYNLIKPGGSFLVHSGMVENQSFPQTIEHTQLLQMALEHGDVELGLKTSGFYKMGTNRSTLHITVKEMMPIIVAAITRGHNQKGRQVVAHCDNISVVTALNSRSCKNTFVNQMLRTLFFVKSAISLSGL